MRLIDKLKEPFPESLIKWRVGATNNAKTKGIALAYIDSRDVMKRLDEVMGLENWQNRYPMPGICDIGLKIGDEWVWKSNGAGETQVEAEKGQASDSFKRAAVLWGIGRYLYYLPTTWAKLKAQGKSYILAETPDLPSWAKPILKESK